MQDPTSYYTGQPVTVLESSGYSDENNNKTYVELEVVQKQPHNTGIPYDPAAVQLAHQSELLFSYDSSPTHQEYHHSHHPYTITGLPSLQSHHHYHELEPPHPPTSSSQHMITSEYTPKSYESIKSVLMLKDSPLNIGQQVTVLAGGPKNEHHLSCGGSSVGDSSNSRSEGPLPFWKERALQIERGTDEICMHHQFITF